MPPSARRAVLRPRPIDTESVSRGSQASIDRRPLARVPALPRVVMASERIILEEFVEGITLLPSEIRRNFELMKSLDRSSSIVLCELSESRKAGTPTREAQAARVEWCPGAAWRRPPRDHRRPRAQRRGRIEAVQGTGNGWREGGHRGANLEIVEAHLHRLDSDLTQFEAHLRAAGEFETVGAAKEVRTRRPPAPSPSLPPTPPSPPETTERRPAPLPQGDEVAVRLDAFENAWILASVIEYKPDTGYCEVADADDPHKAYEVQESQVNELNSANGEGARLTKGEEVLAVYPDTTSFCSHCHATPRRGGAAGPTRCVQLRGRRRRSRHHGSPGATALCHPAAPDAGVEFAVRIVRADGT